MQPIYLLFLAISASAMQLLVNENVSTVATGNGTCFDITNILPWPLHLTGPSPPAQTNLTEGYGYVLDPVHGVKCPNMPDDTVMCQYADFPRGCGSINKPVWRLESFNPIKYTITYLNGFNWRLTEITFIQDDTVKDAKIKMTGEGPYLEYGVEIRAACVGQSVYNSPCPKSKYCYSGLMQPNAEAF
eukprot:TRINITY_DN11336_c0_g9_i1.p1 TRINITY_DN11336_c0_g9~~TRINITY_DN11336_c0_g9_i1.p1  ORF type:complete len:187 (+),score=30.37 TRINITY_DN11336_c0_g9_i1:75-635(+)